MKQDFDDIDICIYHANCADGFASALVVWKNWPNALFIPAQYGDEVPSIVKGRDVIIVDFAYDYDTMLDLRDKTKSLFVIDHHKSHEPVLRTLPEETYIFDMEHSGCVLTWNAFYDEEVPALLAHIEDRDIWKWQMTRTRDIYNGIMAVPRTFEEWAKYITWENPGDYHANRPHIERLKDGGAFISRYQDMEIDKHLRERVSEMDIWGYLVPVVNCTDYGIVSDLLHKLAQDKPFAAAYYDVGHQRRFSLRSSKTGVDVSEIAGNFGGGGHKHAAGFTIQTNLLNVL